VRVVSVSSTAAAFPLPGQVSVPAPALSNGGGPEGESGGVEGAGGVERGAEEDSLGGARLTPIPWLLRRVSVTPSSSPDMQPRRLLPRDEVAAAAAAATAAAATASMTGVNGVDGAGPAVAPEGYPPTLNGARGVNGSSEAPAVSAVNGATGGASASGGDDEVPHARGPAEIGVEDTGPLTGTGGVASLGGGGEANETVMTEGEGS
jgi:hypothetical protein